MPTIIAPGDTADASGFALSPARGDSRPAVATALRRGYRNCTTLRLLLAGVACASLVFLWAANQSRQNSLAKCDVTPPSGGGGLEVDGRPRRVAVCFFGVARSLRWTLPSVKSRVLDVLTGAGMEVETFVHTYVMKEMMNERTGEMHVDYADYANDYQGLHPNRSLVTNQDEFDLLWPDPLSLTHYRWTYSKAEAPNVIRNVFRAYWSMATVLALMELHSLERGFQYDAVVLARPDVWFHADIDLPRRKFPLPEDTVFLPSFDTDPRSGRRKNDRFAYGSFEVMRVVMNRISTLLDPDAAELPPHTESEGVLGYHLQAHSVSVSCIDFPLSRVRMTGDIPEPDYKRVRKACKSGTDPTACGMQDLGFKFPAAVADESK